MARRLVGETDLDLLCGALQFFLEMTALSVLLREKFNKICNAINTPVPNIQSIYRLRNHNNKRRKNSKDAATIVKLWSAYDRNFFFFFLRFVTYS